MLSFSNSCDGYYRSIDVRFCKRCSNACSFCIERNGIKQCGCTNVAEITKSTLSSDRDNVLILGGEPLEEIEKARDYVKNIRKYKKHIYLTTSLPKDIYEHPDTFYEIMEMLDGLNVSLQHYDPDINNDVLNAGFRHDRIQMLEGICRKWPHKVRVSINLVKGYIDSRKEIDKFLDVMESIGVKHVKINELQNEEEIYVSFEKAYGMKLKSPYAHGCQHDVSIRDNMRVTLKRACFCVNSNLEASFADLIKAVLKKLMNIHPEPQVVIYENGMVSNGWIQKKEG